LPFEGLPPGRAGMKLNGKIMATAFPDVHVTRDVQVLEGDRVVERATGRATHLGELNGIPATGKRISWTEIHIYRLQKGQIAEVWSEANFLGLMQQITAKN